ncbi:MAG TPA: calcium-binding protein [Planctomycetota bacterium]|nr:calcium-binding protein [Planctomycetota bacterium]
MRKKPRERLPLKRWKKSRLEDLIHRALQDTEDEEEQQMGFYEALEEHLRFPFKTALGGLPAVVRGLAVGEDDEILAICTRGSEKIGVPLLDLPLPKPPPKGAEWIEAFRLWTAE